MNQYSQRYSPCYTRVQGRLFMTIEVPTFLDTPALFIPPPTEQVMVPPGAWFSYPAAPSNFVMPPLDTSIPVPVAPLDLSPTQFAPPFVPLPVETQSQSTDVWSSNLNIAPEGQATPQPLLSPPQELDPLLGAATILSVPGENRIPTPGSSCSTNSIPSPGGSPTNPESISSAPPPLTESESRTLDGFPWLGLGQRQRQSSQASSDETPTARAHPAHLHCLLCKKKHSTRGARNRHLWANHREYAQKNQIPSEDERCYMLEDDEEG